MAIPLPYSIHPLGDSALLVNWGNVIDEKINAQVISAFHVLQDQVFEGMIEAVPAYSSLAVFYDPYLVQKLHKPEANIYEWVKNKVSEILQHVSSSDEVPGRHFNIPVCYDARYAPDIHDTADVLGIRIPDLISLHTSRIYRVYLMGFLPGFPYMGETDDRLMVSRKRQPVNVKAGSIGLAGKQTGIYPMDSPGGWQIIGRTPIDVFDKHREDPVLLRAGDQVTFYSITPDEFENYQSRNS